MNLFLGNRGTIIYLYKFSLRTDVPDGGHRRKAVAMLNKEQIRKTRGNMETEGNFERDTLSALRQPCLKGIYIFQRPLDSETRAFQVKFNARFSPKN